MKESRNPEAAKLLALLPDSRDAIAEAAKRGRAIVKRRAMVSAMAAVVPIPGIDIAVDIGMLMAMLDEINEIFGLTPEQIRRLAPRRRLSVSKAIAVVGSSFVGRVITREILMTVLRRIARQLATKTVLRFVPLAGQALAASMSYAAIHYIGQRHIEDCMHVAEIVSGERRG